MPRRRTLRFFGGGSGGGAAPTLGAVSVAKDGTNWRSFTFTGAHAPATGDVLIAAFGRVNSTGGWAPSAVLGGITAIQRRLIVPASPNADDALIWLGTVRDVATGAAASLAFDWGAGTQAGNALIFLADLHGWGGLVGGSGGSIFDSGTPDDAHSGSLVTQGSGRLLVGIAGATNNEVLPITASGWTGVEDDFVGTLGAADNSAASLFRKTGGAIGTTETLSASFSASDNDLGVGLLELL